MKLRITVEGKTYDVDVEILDGPQSAAAPSSAPAPSRSAAAAPPSGGAPAPAPPPPSEPAAAGDKVLQSPIAGSVIQVHVKPGDKVPLNHVLLVMEAMKMETNIAAPSEGVIKAVHVKTGDTVRQGQTLIEFE
jgi:glutaconyl-CoA/methylmalonyl-CoA decarboxylase subunit gamma